MNTKKISAVLLSLSIFFCLGAVSVFAEQPGTTNPTGPGTTNPTSPVPVTVNVTLDNPFSKANTLFELLTAVIDNILLPIGGVLAVLAFIYSGFLYVTAQGNESKIATAHRALLYTSIGTAVLLGSWVIAKVIENTINLLK